MTNHIDKETLGEYIGHDIIGHFVDKGFFGGYEVRYSSVLIISLWLFIKGAVLGRVRSDRIEILAKVISQPGGEYNVLQFLNDTSVKMIKDYGKEPESFFDFWMRTYFPSIDVYDMNELQMLNKKKIRLGKILPDLQIYVSLGIGFGAKYPKLVQKMWTNMFEKGVIPDEWERARRFGLNIPKQQTFLSLKEIEQEVLFDLTQYVSKYFPELVEPLDLNP